MRDFIFGVEENVTTAFVIVESVKGFMLLYNKYRKCWEITGGYMEPGESSIDCAIRECKEESNQEISGLKLIGTARYTAMNAAIYYSFLDEEKPFTENDEIRELRWWKPGEEIDEMDIESLRLITLYVQYNETKA